MEQLSLSSKPTIFIKVRLIDKHTSQPLSSSDVVVRFYDKDVFDNDFLGEGVPEKDGNVVVSFPYSSFSDLSVFPEEKPDFYFVVFKQEQPVHQSKVLMDINIEQIKQFQSGKGDVIDLGTFLID
jgi:hypothetical protein